MGLRINTDQLWIQEGWFKNGRLLRGRLITATNYQYEGWVAEDHKGIGKAVSRFKSGQWYTGDFKHGIGEGYGVEHIMPSGETYEGQYSHDVMHGFGHYSFPNGSKLSGTWVNNLKDGVFQMKSPTG